MLRIPHCPAFTVTANEAQKAQTQGTEGAKTEPVSPVTLENVDLSTFAMIFSYWFVPSAFGGNLSLEEARDAPRSYKHCHCCYSAPWRLSVTH